MATQLKELRAAVAAFLKREEGSFVMNGYDLLLRAINNAQLYAQRKHNFELSRVQASVASVSATNGGSLANAVLYGTATPVLVKQIEACFLRFTDGSGSFPIDIESRGRFVRRMRKRYNEALSTQKVIDNYSVTPTNLRMIQIGQTIYIAPGDANILGGATFTVDLDIVKWLAPYTSPSDTDFLLDYAFDFMLFRSLVELNFFLKEDQRVAVSKDQLTDAWASVTGWDGRMIANTTDDNSLD